MTGTLTDPITGEAFRYWTRSDWGARPPTQRYPLSSTREGIFYHHTVTDTVPTPAVLRGVQSYHINGKGWFDIAYSFGIGLAGEWDGDIFELRGFNIQGGHTDGYNSHSHAVVLIGDTRSDHLSPKARRAALAIAREIERRHGGNRVRCHGDVYSTDCPGPEARQWVHGGRPVDNPTPPPPQEDDDMAQRQILWTTAGSRWAAEVAGFDPNVLHAFALSAGETLKHLRNAQAVDWERFVIGATGGPPEREHHNVPDVVFESFELVGPGGISDHAHNHAHT